MNQIYYKTRYLFILLGFFVCSVGMAQSPLPNKLKGNVITALGSPVTSQKKTVSTKTNDPNSNQNNNPNNLFTQKEEKINGKELSAEESESVLKQAQQSQNLFEQKLTNSIAKTNAQDSVNTKVRSFAKSSNLTAKNIFEVKKGEFDLSASDKMQLKSISDNHGRTLATYQQMHNSVPVEGAIYKVRENKTKIDAFGATAKKLTVSSNYKISAAAGLEIALKTVNAKQYIWESKKLGALLNKDISTKPKGELVYVGPNFSSELKDYYLTWKYDIYAINPQSSQTIYVDANTGKIILIIDLNRDSSIKGSVQSIGKGKSRYAGEVTFNTKQYADGYRLEALQGKYNVPIVTWNMNHANQASDEVITEFIDDDNIWNELHNKDNDEVAIDIHWGMQKTIEYYGEKFNRNSIDNKGMTIIGLAHLGTNVENASWTGGWAQFGDGYNTPYVGLGITAHELTHGVTRFTAGLIYQGESGALNESFSDIFGVAVEFYVGRESSKNIWLLGDELYTHGSMRNMANPKAQGQPDTYGGKNWANPLDITYDNGGVHINSGVTNYWFYLLSEGGQGVNDLNNSYDVKAIGLAKAEKIAYITLTEYLSPSSNFSDMRQATLMVTEDLYGLGSEEYKQVTNAWYAIGVGTAFTDKQIVIVSVENPVETCGSLKGNEPFYVKIKNTGSVVIKANEILNYKLRLMMIGFGNRLTTQYTNDSTISFAKDLAIGEETTIKIQENIPYITSDTKLNYVEVKFDFNPVIEFGAKDGISFVSSFMVISPQKDFDLKVVGLNLPSYSGTALSAKHALSVTVYNLGCQDLPAGSKLKIGYANTLAGNETIWKEITLSDVFKGNSEMTIPFDSTIDLSPMGLHTYEAFVSYSQDPVATNNSGISAVYSGIVTQFPYTQDFERTSGGWYSKSLATNQKFVWQASSHTFRDTKSKYLWATVNLANPSERMELNADFTLQSPVFDFTNIAFPYVEFDIATLFHNGYDGLVVEYSEDNQNWKKVTGIDYPSTLHYDEKGLLSGPWFTGIEIDYKKMPIGMRLNDLAGKKGAIRFRVATDNYRDGFIGAYIDNIHIDNAPYDLVLLDASIDAGSCKIDNNNAKITTKIINNFATAAEQVNFTVKILDSAKNEVFSKTEKASLVFTKFRDTITYSIPNIDLKSIGDNTITVTVFPDDVTQDVRPQNNTYTFNYDNWDNEDMKISVLPYIMDFEDVTKYKGWRTSENKGAAGWKHGTYLELRSPSFFLTEHTKFMASNDDICNCDSSNDMLTSPVLDLSNYKEAHLTFDAFGDGARLSDGYVKVSTDGGKTWETVFKMYYINNWIEYHVDLTPYAGKPCVLVAFQHDDNGLFADGFAVDNIKFTEKSEYLQLSNLSVPETVYEDSPSHQFFIAARNVFYKKVEKAEIEYQITQNGKAIGEPVTLQRNDQIQQYQTIVYTLDNIPQLAAGNYEITVKIITNGQSKAEAATLTKSFEVIAKAPGLDIETFSNVAQGSLFGSKGYTSNQSDENYPWRNVTQPDSATVTIPRKDHTEDASAMMLYSQLEYYAMYGELVSPMYKLSENTTALEFYYGMQCNYINSFGIDIKTAGGEWTEIWKDSKQGSYVDTEWQKGAVNLIKYAGKSVMLRFRHAKEGGYSYMVLDDLKIISEPVLDVSVEILSPRDVCGGSEFKVKLTNEGQIAIAANTIQLDVEYSNTNEAISESVEAGIPVGGSIEYILKKQIKLDDSGDSHVFNVNAKLENDAIQQNNEIKNYIYQGVPSDFKIFDNTVIHGYTGKTLYVDAQTNISAKKLKAVSYKWSTGDVSNGIEITKAGDYTVTLEMKNGCTLTETITATFDTFESELVSGVACGPEVVLNPGKYKSYEWFDGSTEPTITITKSGDYFVTVYNENGIGKTFSTTVSIDENVVPEIQIAGDKKLTASINAASYQWFLNDRPIPNATEKSIITVWEGNYSLQVTTKNGCNNVSASFDSKGMLLGKITNLFRVFPNPAVDIVNIFLADKIEGEIQISIYAIDGKSVWNKTYTSLPSTLNITALSPGVYVLDCSIQGKRYTAKIIKK
ncbi:M4 family metallopeptidase [Flavobacterium sp. N1736]|uniref:M4 family metallopeptidase n=1 Tax=Flavobacterium sp. N1736 TaxID=2986823 RepID=UPI0022249967|nr:M4 family metallopeptidase [Flavobacterium sp. N1736]